MAEHFFNPQFFSNTFVFKSSYYLVVFDGRWTKNTTCFRIYVSYLFVEEIEKPWKLRAKKFTTFIRHAYFSHQNNWEKKSLQM